MKWDGQSYFNDIKYGLSLILTDEDKEKAQSMQPKEFTEHFMDLHKNDMECYTRFPGAGSIILRGNSNGIEFDFQRILNNGDKTITLSWSMAAKLIRTWEIEKKHKNIKESVHKIFGMQHSDEEENTMSFGAAAKTSKFKLSSFVGETTAKDNDNIVEIPINKLKPFNSGRQPFRMYTSDKMNELMESIRASGLLQPILVWDK